MLPRGSIDIRWTDLGYGVGSCLRPGHRSSAQSRAEAAWSPGGDTLAALSVRSGFDTLLTALDLPPGSEVVTSALTIEDIPRIMAEHGLVAVPVDVDMNTLSVDVTDLERAVTPRTCAVLVAHLFGARMQLDGATELARRRGLFFIEDCAQAYTGDGYRGHPDGDVSMFSFGPIKTNTALGGAVLRVKDPALLASMREVQAQQPVQGRREFLRKVVKYAGLKVASRPMVFGAVAVACRLLGTNHDVVISRAVRGFSGPDFFNKIRRQPSYPLLALLERRLRTFDRRLIDRRRNLAEGARASLPTTTHVGPGAHCHSHWIVPITSRAPEVLTRHLWARGFDATRGETSLAVLDPPLDRTELTATEAADTMSRVVYLPVHLGANRRQLRRLARAVTDFEAERRPG